MENKIEISANQVSKRIYTLRGVQIMLDSDLAGIYEVETRILNEALKRNIKRFPSDFMFKPSKEELENLRSQIAISNLENHSNAGTKPALRSQSAISSFKQPLSRRGGSRYLPSVFTEEGVGMLSSVLNSQRAIEINIEIIRAFVQLRKQPKTQQLDWALKFESLENEVKIMRQRLDQPETQSKNEKPQDPVSRIQNIVARHWGLKVDDLKSARRTKAISLPRQIAIYLIRTQIQMSFSDIGSHFGQRDHTSILYAHRKIEAACCDNNMIREKVSSSNSRVNSPSKTSPLAPLQQLERVARAA